MEVQVNIREITSDDAESIQNIRTAISEDDADFNFEKFIEQQIARDSVKSSLVAELDGKIVGFMISSTLFAGFGLKKIAWIMAIGVHPDQMSMGIGMELANKVCEIYKAMGIKEIYSSVLWDSTDVLFFFKKLGFERSDFINLKKIL